MFFVSANPRVSFTSFDLNVANMDNFFAPVFTMGKYYTQGDKVLMPLAIQVHHAVCDGFHVGRMLNELQQYCDEWQGGGVIFGTVAKLAMRQPFVLFKGLTFQKLCLLGAFRPGDHHNKMLRLAFA